MKNNGGFLLGVSLGAVAALCSYLAITSRALLTSIESIWAVALGGAITAVLLLCLLYASRRTLMRKTFGDVQGSLEAATDELRAGIHDVQRPTRSAEHFVGALRELVTVAGGIVARRVALQVALALGGGLIAVLGSVLLVRQTRALDRQTTALDLQDKRLQEQISLLGRQNAILAGEGQWERFWTAHHALDPNERLNAQRKLVADGIALKGVSIEGGAFQEFNDAKLVLAHPKEQLEELPLRLRGLVGRIPHPWRLESARRDLPRFVMGDLDRSLGSRLQFISPATQHHNDMWWTDAAVELLEFETAFLTRGQAQRTDLRVKGTIQGTHIVDSGLHLGPARVARSEISSSYIGVAVGTEFWDCKVTDCAVQGSVTLETLPKFIRCQVDGLILLWPYEENLETLLAGSSHAEILDHLFPEETSPKAVYFCIGGDLTLDVKPVLTALPAIEEWLAQR